MICILLSLSFDAMAKVYKSVDEKGHVVFSDVPKPGSKEVDIPSLSVHQTGSAAKSGDLAPSLLPANAAPANEPVIAPTSKRPAIDGVKKEYTFSLVMPSNQDTIWSNEGIITVEANISPDLQEGDQLAVLVDGSILAKSPKNIPIQLKNIDRGEHTVQVQILDARGEVLKQTSPVTVFLHKTTKSMRRPGPGQP